MYGWMDQTRACWWSGTVGALAPCLPVPLHGGAFACFSALGKNSVRTLSREHAHCILGSLELDITAGEARSVATSSVGLDIGTIGPCPWLSILARGDAVTTVD